MVEPFSSRQTARHAPLERRAMFGPHLSLLSLFFSVIQGYLPTADLTNSIVSPYENLIEKDPDGLGESGSAEIDEPSASPYRNRMTFRRRNMISSGINLGPGSSPFSRMNYRAGYGSNRRGPFNSPNPNSYANSYNYNGFGGGVGPIEPAPFSNSGLMGNRERNFGYFGSTVGLKNRNMIKGRFPNYYEVLANRPTNDLMGSFNPEAMRGNMPSHKFGQPNTFIPQIPNREIPSQYFNPYYPDMSPYGGEYGGRILSNRWNDKSGNSHRVNVGEHDNTVDGYAASAKQKTQKTQKKTVA